jgi:hypothetical protein
MPAFSLLHADCYRACLSCFVMLSQFTLSLSKGSIAVGVFLLSNIHLVYAFPPFALMQKVEPKHQGKPKWLRLFCRPRTAAVITTLIIYLLRSKQLVSLLLTTFSKPHAFPFKCNKLQALYPAFLSCRTIIL